MFIEMGMIRRDLGVLALLFGSLTHFLHLEAVLGAFIAGILVEEIKRFDHRLRHQFEAITLGVFAPIFFALSGIRVNLAELARPMTAFVALLVLAIAIFGKFAGACAGAKISRMGNWEAVTIGSAMNARGALEIIVAPVGLSVGILSSPTSTACCCPPSAAEARRSRPNSSPGSSLTRRSR